MLQYRRISILALGLWIGAAVYCDVAVTQNFQTVDRFLNSPHTSQASAEISQIGRDRVRALLRRNAAEENNVLFENTEWAELALAVVIAALVAFEPRANKFELTLSLCLAALVLLQHFVLTPQIVTLGRTIDSLAPGDAQVGRFWLLHGIYSGAEIIKLVGLALLALRRCVRRPKEAVAYV